MRISYNKLWKMLIDKEMTKKELMNATGISKSTMDKMGRGEQVSLEILERICRHFKCDVQDVISYCPEEKSK